MKVPSHDSRALLWMVLAACAGTLPLILLALLGASEAMAGVVIGLNVISWGLVARLVFIGSRNRNELLQMVSSLGLHSQEREQGKLLGIIAKEVDRKRRSTTVDAIEKKISTRDELSRALQGLVETAYTLLDADSAEIALFDKESGAYHSSLVLGKPFQQTAQEMLSSSDSVDSSIMLQPISFAGAVLGCFRVALRHRRKPTSADVDILRLIALQSSIALVNSRYNEELLKMRRSSDESMRAKTGFLANLSHEIRGPLGIMLNGTELILDGLCGAVTEDQSETLRMVKQNGQHLLELINDVLDYAKSESGRVVPNAEQIVLNELLIDVTNVVRSQALQKGHKLVCRPSDAAIAISCDRRHIRQMMINLLTNAIKYTPSGGKIEVWAERIPGNKVKINVQDTGVGIEAAQRHKVFEAFERIDNAYSIKQTGTGLGMSLTRRLAEANGGIIDFSSTPGQGSLFWLVFPSTNYTAISAEVSVTDVIAPQAVQGETVLVAESDENERGMLTRYLEHLGFAVIVTATAEETTAQMGSRRIDLFIIGNNVIDDNQNELLRLIRGNPLLSSVPIILVSSRAFVFDVEEYLKLGVDRCVPKPLELKLLGQTVREVLDSRNQPVRKAFAEPVISKVVKAPPKNGTIMH